MSSENVLTPYEKVLAARKSDRPDIMKYIEVLFDDFIEMHGDRYYKDCLLYTSPSPRDCS